MRTTISRCGGSTTGTVSLETNPCAKCVVMVTMVVVVVRMAKDNKKRPLAVVVSFGCKASVVGTEVDLTGFDSCVLRLAQRSVPPVSVGPGL